MERCSNNALAMGLFLSDPRRESVAHRPEAENRKEAFARAQMVDASSGPRMLFTTDAVRHYFYQLGNDSRLGQLPTAASNLSQSWA